MAGYQTKARKQLLEFLEANPDQGYTAEELSSALEKAYGTDAPGKSTIYRLVGKLTQENQLRRYEQEDTHCFYYQIAGCGCREHLHLKCTDCGRLIHMKESTSVHLIRDILINNGFSVDEHRTVLLGRCDLCERNLSS